MRLTESKPMKPKVLIVDDAPRMPSAASAAVLAALTGSAWDRVNAVFAEADKLEELTKLRMERPGETRESAFEWAKEMYQRYSPNADFRRGDLKASNNPQSESPSPARTGSE